MTVISPGDAGAATGGDAAEAGPAESGPDVVHPDSGTGWLPVVCDPNMKGPAPVPADKLDLLLAIDNSASMADKQATIAGAAAARPFFPATRRIVAPMGGYEPRC